MLANRLIILSLVLLGLLAAWGLLRWRTTRLRRRGASDLVSVSTRRPLVIAFSTPDCVPCRTLQKPALEELIRRHSGRVDVREADATLEAELAKRFGILTVPSTVVVDRDGHILAINHGVAPWEKLASQLRLDGSEPQKAGRGQVWT